MFKADQEFDEFFKYFSVADVDVQFIDNDGDDWMHYAGETDDDAGSAVATKVIDIPAATTTTCIQKPATGRGRGRSRPAPTPSARTPGRFKARQQAATPRRRRRDRRRNASQRQRENDKRKEKQDEFMTKRRECFEAERTLRWRVACILSDLAARVGMSVHQAMHMLPPDLLNIMQSSDAAMTRFREFTGQKHICAKLNSFPMWPAVDYSTGSVVKLEYEYPETLSRL